MLEGRRVGLETGILKEMGLFGSRRRPQMRNGFCGGNRGPMSGFDRLRNRGTHRSAAMKKLTLQNRVSGFRGPGGGAEDAWELAKTASSMFERRAVRLTGSPMSAKALKYHPGSSPVHCQLLCCFCLPQRARSSRLMQITANHCETRQDGTENPRSFS